MSLTKLAIDHLANMRSRSLFTTESPEADDEDFAPLCLYFHHQASVLFDLWKETPNITLREYVKDEEGKLCGGEGLPIAVANIVLSGLATLARLGVEDDELDELLVNAHKLDAIDLVAYDSSEDAEEAEADSEEPEQVESEDQLSKYFDAQGVPLAVKE